MVGHTDGQRGAGGIVIRVQSELDGYTDCWIDVESRWTNGDLRVLYGGRQQWISMWLSKVPQCHLATAQGDVLTTPQQVLDRWDDIDLRMNKFINTSLTAVVDYLSGLGELSRRISFVERDHAGQMKT